MFVSLHYFSFRLFGILPKARSPTFDISSHDDHRRQIATAKPMGLKPKAEFTNQDKSRTIDLDEAGSKLNFRAGMNQISQVYMPEKGHQIVVSYETDQADKVFISLINVNRIEFVLQPLEATSVKRGEYLIDKSSFPRGAYLIKCKFADGLLTYPQVSF